MLTGNLLLLFLFWELVALCAYALIAFHNDDPKAVAEGIKALIITQFGGIRLLIGVLFAGAHLGDYQVRTLLDKAATLSPGVLAAIAFGFLVAPLAKSAQVPLHTWLPDAMEAPTPVSALIHAATMVNAGIYLLARFYPAFATVTGWTTLIIFIGALSALLGGLMALVAFDLKRILAYSTISQLGYMVYAVGVGGIFASQFHLLNHAIFKALLFLGAGAISHTLGTRDIREMGGVGRRMPYVYVTFGIGALGLVGVPILNGFWSKELILDVGFKNGPTLWIMLAGGDLTALYGFRMVWLVFYGQPRRSENRYHAYPTMRVALGVLAFGVVMAWSLVEPISDLFAHSLPFHGVDEMTTTELVTEVQSGPVLPFALLLMAFGLILWWWRTKAGVSRVMHWPGLASGFGFEWVNRSITRVVKNIAEAVRATQTGELNWNIAGIVGGLIILLIRTRQRWRPFAGIPAFFPDGAFLCGAAPGSADAG